MNSCDRSVTRADSLGKLLLPISALDFLRLNVGLVERLAVSLPEIDLLNLLQDEVITVLSKAHDVEDKAVAGYRLFFLVVLCSNVVLHGRRVDIEATVCSEDKLLE